MRSVRFEMNRRNQDADGFAFHKNIHCGHIPLNQTRYIHKHQSYDNTYIVKSKKISVFPLNKLIRNCPNIAIIFFRQKKNPVMQMNQHLSKKSNKHKWRSVSSGSALWQNNERSRLQKMKDSIHNIMTAHQRAKYKPEADKVRPSGQPEKKKKKGWSLPHWTVYIAWTRKCRFFF